MSSIYPGIVSTIRQFLSILDQREMGKNRKKVYINTLQLNHKHLYHPFYIYVHRIFAQSTHSVPMLFMPRKSGILEVDPFKLVILLKMKMHRGNYFSLLASQIWSIYKTLSSLEILVTDRNTGIVR